MTLLVCATCQAPIPERSPHCPKCGPESLTLILSEDPARPLTPSDADVPRRLVRALGAQYEVVRLLGRGGFAEVYEVRDAELERRLAVKVLRPDIAWTAGMLARFKQEARAIARLNHPNTVPIHFVGEGEGLGFYVMPFIEGRTLADILRTDGALDPEHAVVHAGPILEALEYAHRQGLVHRDIKPDNVIIEAGTGRPLLLDFGIAKSLDSGSAHHTQTGFVVGTPLYMSPEQALGNRNVDARTDVYAMGAMLFQMLTGAPPFDGGSSQEIVSKHLTEPVPIASARNARIPRWLSDIILRAMAKQPAARFASAAEMLEALRAGRPTDGTEAVTAARIAAQIARPDLMLLEPPPDPATVGAGHNATTARMSSHSLTPLDAPPPRRWRRRLGFVAAGGLLALALGTAYAGWPRTWLVVENQLAEPVSITVHGTTQAIPARDSVRISIPKDKRLDARWAIVRPATASGAPLGLPLEGGIAVERPRGEIRHRIDVTTVRPDVYTPVVENGTGRRLRLAVGGDSGTPACDCPITADASAEHLGYYPLSATTQLRFTDSAGRSARIGGLGDRQRGLAGIIPVVVSEADFPAPKPRRRAEPTDTAVVAGANSTSPLTGAIPPILEPPAPDRPKPARPKPDSTDPLKRIFPSR